MTPHVLLVRKSPSQPKHRSSGKSHNLAHPAAHFLYSTTSPNDFLAILKAGNERSRSTETAGHGAPKSAVCRKITLRHANPVACAGGDTPCISHKCFATLLLCRMRHTQCLMGHRKQPKPVQRVPLMAQSVPKLALLLLVISRHITQQIQLLKIKNHNQTSLYWPAFLSAPISAPSAMRSLVLLGSSFQRHRRWLLFDFDDKKLARAFAHSAR